MEDFFKVTENEYLPLRDIVFNNIRNAIISGELKPGERLLENQLSEKTGVSRTPIREALRKLELEGYVEMVPRKGATVAVATQKDIEDVLEIRATLEALAAKLACRYMTESQISSLTAAKNSFMEAADKENIEAMAASDTEFHTIIFSSANNQKLVQLINNLSEQIYRFRIAYLKNKSVLKKIISEHDALLASIIAGDSKLAAMVATKHIENQKNAVIKSLL